MDFNVYYSFLHNNHFNNKADGYRVYRRETIGGVEGDFVLVNTIDATGVGDAIEVTGVDVVTGCNNYTYDYKVSAFNVICTI